MKRVNISTKQIGKFAGKWVVIDPIKDKVIAVGETLSEIDALITRPAKDKRPSGTVPAAFKVPRKDEGPYSAFMKKLSLLTFPYRVDTAGNTFPIIPLTLSQFFVPKWLNHWALKSRGVVKFILAELEEELKATSIS